MYARKLACGHTRGAVRVGEIGALSTVANDDDVSCQGLSIPCVVRSGVMGSSKATTGSFRELCPQGAKVVWGTDF